MIPAEYSKSGVAGDRQQNWGVLYVLIKYLDFILWVMENEERALKREEKQSDLYLRKITRG